MLPAAMRTVCLPATDDMFITRLEIKDLSDSSEGEACSLSSLWLVSNSNVLKRPILILASLPSYEDSQASLAS